jgi:acyl-homoserine-lactone acylase
MRRPITLVLALGTALACAPASLEPGPGGYSAEIRRTSYGVPHIRANDWASLGFGSGYAIAEDNVCLLADIFVTASAQRTRWFGAEPANVASDLYHQLLIERGQAAEPGLDPRVDRFIEGATAGYNQYLRDTGTDALRDPTCRGAAWVQPIDVPTWRGLHRRSQFERALSPLMVAAHPPGQAAALAPPEPDLELLQALGSNAIGLGSEATADGKALFLGNPHQPWEDSYRFYMKHLTIPGELDIIGASPVDRPFAGVGHGCCLAWNGTVSRATRHSFYRLQLAPGRPTAYVFDGEVREMNPREVTIQVPGPDGSPVEQRHRFWQTHLGPVVVSEQLGMRWTDSVAWALRHVSAGWRTSNEMLELAGARSVREAKSILDRHQGWPVNFIAADHTGEVLYADPGAAAHLEDAQLDACSVEGPRGALDGSRSACEWGSAADAAAPGIFPPRRLPFLFRRDWVANSNDSYWLTQPAAPLEGYPRSLGNERTSRSLRTRSGIVMLRERLSGSDGRAPGLTLPQLWELALANRDLAGELLRDELVAQCSAQPQVALADATRVDLRPACEVPAGWDLHANLDSRGAHLFREFLREGGARWREPFDHTRPVDTPTGLAADDPEVLRALGRAVLKLRDASVALDARLADVQSVTRAGRRIPIHGGPGRLGIFNAIRSPLEAGGYSDVKAGSSFVMAVRFGDDGPSSRAIVTYSQSADPSSPHHTDQIELFSRKGWVEMRWREADILSDPELRSYRVNGPRPARTR